jgi:hypothetical protein
MESQGSLLFASGRIAPRPFVLATTAVYVTSFLSQFLLASPITMRASVVPFVAAQLVLGWAWYVLHACRLRDAGRSTGIALALIVIYALAIVLLLLVIGATSGMSQPDSGEASAASGILDFLLIAFLAGLVAGNPAFGMFGYVLLAALVLITLPIAIAVVFSIWLAGQPSKPRSVP